MDFTIITPSLNQGRFLSDCLTSVAEQQGVTLEHLIIDGLSTDESSDVAALFPHATWISEADSGMSNAINKGFQIAKGKWVMWLNADDRLKPGILEEVLISLLKTTADIAFGKWDFIQADGSFLRHVECPAWSPFVHIHHHCYIGSTAAFYRNSSIISKGFRLREDFHYVMDGEFYARLHGEGKSFERLVLCIADFRLHGDNASQRFLGKSRDMDRILAAENQHIESRAIRRAYGLTLFGDPYLNGLMDGFLWILAKAWKQILKLTK